MDIPPKYEDVVAQLEAYRKGYVTRLAYEAVQQRLTVAEQRAGELEALLLESNELLYVIQDGLGGNLWSAVDVMRGKVFAALKPVEEVKNASTE